MPRFSPTTSLFKYLPDREDFFDRPCLRYTPINELNDPFESQMAFTSSGNTSLDHNSSWNEIVQNYFSGFVNSITDSGVLSLSATHNNLLMWAHYTNNHHGLVIELDPNSYFLKNIDKVIYSTQRLSLDDIFNFREHNASLLYRNIFHKSIHWEYEEEWRAFKNWVSGESPMFKPGIIGLVELPTDIIRNVYLGMRASDSFMESAKKFCMKNSKIGLYQAQLNHARYELDFYPVDI